MSSRTLSSVKHNILDIICEYLVYWLTIVDFNYNCYCIFQNSINYCSHSASVQTVYTDAKTSTSILVIKKAPRTLCFQKACISRLQWTTKIGVLFARIGGEESESQWWQLIGLLKSTYSWCLTLTSTSGFCPIFLIQNGYGTEYAELSLCFSDWGLRVERRRNRHVALHGRIQPVYEEKVRSENHVVPKGPHNVWFQRHSVLENCSLLSRINCASIQVCSRLLVHNTSVIFSRFAVRDLARMNHEILGIQFQFSRIWTRTASHENVSTFQEYKSVLPCFVTIRVR